MKHRRIPPSEGEMFRLRGGNERLPIAFARRLDPRVKLAHRITAIRQSEHGVTVSYRAYGYDESRTVDADFFVNCISLTVFRSISITPALSPAKQYVVDNLTYTSHPFYVFEASSKFWLDDGLKSINMELDHPLISSIWEMPSITTAAPTGTQSVTVTATDSTTATGSTTAATGTITFNVVVQ